MQEKKFRNGVNILPYKIQKAKKASWDEDPGVTTLMTFIVILLAELCTPEKASYWPKSRSTNHWNRCTFEETFAVGNFLGGEAGPSGTELLVLRRAFRGTLLALLGAPGCPDWAAAGVHAVAPNHGQGALLVLVPQEAGFQADICRREQTAGWGGLLCFHCLKLPALCEAKWNTHSHLL